MKQNGFSLLFLKCNKKITWFQICFLVLVQFLRQIDDVMFWIKDKEAFVTASESGHDLEHVEVLQRKFEEFQKDLTSQEYRVNEVRT